MGRPVQAYDAQGGKVWEAVYDIYGGLRNIEGGKRFITFRQAGQYEDVETGLYYNRFRYYNPETGSYLSKDPIGLLGNNPNSYAYTYDSNTEVDILGLNVIFDSNSMRWRNTTTGRFTSMPTDLSGRGTINFSDIDKLAKNKGLTNLWTPDSNPLRFSDGGYHYEFTQGKYNYTIHGHGADINAIANYPNSNSAMGATSRISRTPVAGGKTEYLLQDGRWSRKINTNHKANLAHIPTNGSPHYR